MHYTTTDGRQVLDGRAGLCRVNAGAQRNFEAVARQLDTLDYSPAFPNSTGSRNYNPASARLATASVMARPFLALAGSTHGN
jgi:adenosylmethionine-8-amino-7-oxononanoate aminotransferase